MSENIYKALVEGGPFSLPYLLHIRGGDIDIYVVNDNMNVVHNGHVYNASNFSYTPSDDGSGTLEIEVVNANGIIDILEDCTEIDVEVTGVFLDGEVTELRQHRHRHGEASWNGKSLTMSLEKDGRLDMTFPAFLFTSYNNRGNS